MFYGSVSLVELSTISGFNESEAEDGYPKTSVLDTIQVYWGTGERLYLCDLDIAGGALKDLRVMVHNGDGLVHVGAVKEMCEFFKIFYPKTQMKIFEDTFKMRAYRIGHFARKFCYSNKQRRSMVTEYEETERIKQLQEGLDALVPYTMRADNTKIETARLRCVRDILLWEIKIQRMRTMGFNSPVKL